MRRWAAITVFTVAAVSFAARGVSAQNATAPSAPSDSTSQTAQNSTATQSASNATAGKKVWTNDDVGDLRGRSPISTVGVANPKQEKPSAKPASPATVKQYREQILKLQGQLPDLDQKISELQGGINGNTVNSTRHVTGTKIDDWHDELARLQQQRSDIATRISTLQDQARHSGVPENEIPE
jgi:hypothetical protein